ncbi:MAG: hypothetical protein IJ133_00795 [Clostridia bacterium]|nr:hypothetical protein [Clostridia bacterium]
MNNKHSRTKSVASLVLALLFVFVMAVPGIASSADVLASNSIVTGASRSVGTFAGGSGTVSDPYHIQTAEQLQNIQNALGSSFVLDNDIDLKGVDWKPIGKYGIDLKDFENPPTEELFHGDFNGNGHTIRNLKVVTNNILGAGLFGAVGEKAHLHDVNLTGFDIEGVFLVGGLSGYACGDAVFENITRTGKNSMEGLQLVGGIVGGSTNKLFRNISAQADINILMVSQGAEGGIIVGGAEDSDFIDCHVTGGSIKAMGSGCYGLGGISGSTIGAENVTGCTVENLTISTGKKASMVGGLAGYTGENPEEGPATSIRDCSVRNVTIQVGDNSERIGVLVGSGYYTKLKKKEFPAPCNFNVENCTVSGTINGGKMVGAISGYAQDTDSITNVSASVLYNGTAAPVIGANPQTVPVSKLR